MSDGNLRWGDESVAMEAWEQSSVGRNGKESLAANEGCLGDADAQDSLFPATEPGLRRR